MKTLVIAFVAFCTLSLVSCGGGSGYCSCVKEAAKLAENQKGEEAIKKAGECAKMVEGKTPEEVAKLTADCK